MKLRIEKVDECWLWQGCLDKDGYGRVLGGYAHRAVYEDLVGPIPTGLEIDHLCFNRSCVNPDHLEPVTRAENMRRRAANRTHCANGHEYTPENTRLTKGHLGRICRACTRDYARRYRLRRRARTQDEGNA